MKKQTLLLVALCLAGCNPAIKSEDGPVGKLRSDIAAHNFYQGYLDYPSVEEQLKTVGEGALGYEYEQLLDASAERGQADWPSIFQDPLIPVDQKKDLVQMIDAIAREKVSLNSK